MTESLSDILNPCDACQLSFNTLGRASHSGYYGDPVLVQSDAGWQVVCNGRKHLQGHVCERVSYVCNNWQLAVDQWNAQNKDRTEEFMSVNRCEVVGCGHLAGHSVYPNQCVDCGNAQWAAKMKAVEKEVEKVEAKQAQAKTYEGEPRGSFMSFAKKEGNKYQPEPVLKTVDQFDSLMYRIGSRRIDLELQRQKYDAYCAVCLERGDRHGVIDAQCEMRELDAVIKELRGLEGL